MQIKDLIKSELDRLRDENSTLREKVSRLQREKDDVYFERNQLVAFLSKLYPSGYTYTEIQGWKPDSCHCVIIDLPTGQASWHFHKSEAQLFEHLTDYKGAWDGHTTEQKYSHIRSFKSSGSQKHLEEVSI